MPKKFHLETVSAGFWGWPKFALFWWFINLQQLLKALERNFVSLDLTNGKVWNLLIQSWGHELILSLFQIVTCTILNASSLTEELFYCHSCCLVSRLCFAISRQTIQKYLTNKKPRVVVLRCYPSICHTLRASLFYRPNFTPLTSLEEDKNLPFEQLAKV
mgnify:CR=1 FL=1